MTTTWITLQSTDLTDLLTPEQLDALTTGAPTSGEEDPVATSLGEAIAQARLAAAFGGNTLSPDPSRIAPELRETVTHLALAKLHPRIVGLYLTPAQTEAITQAEGVLEAVSGGAYRLSPAEDAPSDSPPSFIKVTHHRKNRITANRLAEQGW